MSNQISLNNNGQILYQHDNGFRKDKYYQKMCLWHHVTHVDVTWHAQHHKSQIDCLFISLFSLTAKKTSKLSFYIAEAAFPFDSSEAALFVWPTTTSHNTSGFVGIVPADIFHIWTGKEMYCESHHSNFTWSSWHPRSRTTRMFIRAITKENIKALHYWCSVRGIHR